MTDKLNNGEFFDEMKRAFKYDAVIDDEGPDYWLKQFMFTLSGLAWAVGCLEGMGQKDTYAHRVLARLESPSVVVPPADES